MDKIHEFVSDLLDQRGVTDLEEDVRKHLIDEMTEMLLDKIDRAAIGALPEDKAIELADGLDKGTIKPEDVTKFMQDAGLNLEEISLITMMQFRDLYLGDIDAKTEEKEIEAEKAAAGVEDKAGAKAE